MMSIIRDYHKQLHANKMDNLEEMHKFLERYNSLSLTREKQKIRTDQSQALKLKLIEKFSTEIQDQLASWASLVAQLLKIRLQCRRPRFDSWVRMISWRRDRLLIPVFLGFSGCHQCGRLYFHPWVGKIPWRREWLPTSVSWTGEFLGLYSLWGHKESDTTEKISLSFISDGFTVNVIKQRGVKTYTSEILPKNCRVRNAPKLIQ